MHNKMRTVRRVEFGLLGRCRFGIPWYAERCRIEAHGGAAKKVVKKIVKSRYGKAAIKARPHT